jgi:hypothetical protein
MRATLQIFASLLFTFTLLQCKPKAAVNKQPTATTAPFELSATDVTIITNKEISSWEFAKTKQLDKLQSLLAEDYQAFFGKVIMTKSDVLQSFQSSNIKAYRMSNIRTKKVSDDVAIIYYEVLQDATDPEGEKWVPQVAVSNTYVKRGNAWYSIFYHETPMFKGL